MIQGQFNPGTQEAPGLVLGYGIQNAIGFSHSNRLQPSEMTVILPKKGKVSVADPMQSLSEGIATATGSFAIQQEFDNKYVLTNIDFVKQQLGLGKDEFSAAEIKLRSNNSIDVKKELLAMLGDGYLVQTRYEQNQRLYQTMRLEKWFIFAVLTLILIVAAFNMISALTMLVLEKQRDISILQSMGASRRTVLGIFLTEGLLLAGIGAGVGIILALAICWLQLKYHLIKLEGGTFLIDYFPVEMHLADFMLVTATVGVIAFLAAWVPARNAANQPVSLR
jgi:lipoprotein-releasing system permease protein